MRKLHTIDITNPTQMSKHYNTLPAVIPYQNVTKYAKTKNSKYQHENGNAKYWAGQHIGKLNTTYNLLLHYNISTAQ